MSELHPAAVGPQPDHSADPSPLDGAGRVRLADLRSIAIRRALTPDEQAEMDALAPLEYNPHPAPDVAPPEHPPALVAMHGILDEALSWMMHIAALVPTASNAGAQLMALRQRLARVLDPPKP